MSVTESFIGKFTERDHQSLLEIAMAQGLILKIDTTPNKKPCAYFYQNRGSWPIFCVTKSREGWLIHNDQGWVQVKGQAAPEKVVSWPL